MLRLLLLALLQLALAQAKAGMVGEQRIYFQSWSVGQACSSDGACRAAAVEYLTNGTVDGVGSMAYSPLEVQIWATVGLLGEDKEPIDLRQGKLRAMNATQINGVCRPRKAAPDGVSLTLKTGYQVLKQSSGCLNHEKSSPWRKPERGAAFVAALVRPPPPGGTNSMFGGEVKGCTAGLCVVALRAPAGDIARAAAEQVAQTCGAARYACTVAVGDWGLGSGKTVADSWKALIGGAEGEPKYINSNTLASNIPGMSRAMTVGQGQPLQKQFGNVTGEAVLVDQLFPCEKPGDFGNDGCKQ